MHRRTLFVDAMGTLLTLQAPVPRLVAALREQVGADVSEGQARTALAAEIAHYRAHMGDARDERSLSELRGRCADVLFGALPPLPQLTGADADTRTRVLLSALHFTAFPDALRLLERARADGVSAIVVSNWDVSLTEVLERAGLGPLLDGVVVSATVGAAKPSPAIFARALELAGAGAADCLHVGDSLTEDVAGASAVGIEAVLLDRSGEAATLDGAEPDTAGRDRAGSDGVRVIVSLDELSP